MVWLGACGCKASLSPPEPLDAYPLRNHGLGRTRRFRAAKTGEPVGALAARLASPERLARLGAPLLSVLARAGPAGIVVGGFPRRRVRRESPRRGAPPASPRGPPRRGARRGPPPGRRDGAGRFFLALAPGMSVRAVRDTPSLSYGTERATSPPTDSSGAASPCRTPGPRGRPLSTNQPAPRIRRLAEGR